MTQIVTGQQGVVTTQFFIDAIGEAPMLSHPYSEKDLDALIAPGMSIEKIMSMFGQPFLVISNPDGTENMGYVLNPARMKKDAGLQLTGFSVTTTNGQVVRWAPDNWGRPPIVDSVENENGIRVTSKQVTNQLPDE